MARGVKVIWWNSELAVNFATIRALKGLRRIGVHMVKDIKLSLSGTSGSAPGGPPGADKGKLRRSIEYKLGGDRTGPFVRVGSWTVPYARIQEKGGTIVPKQAKALAIPISEDAKKARALGWGPEFPGFVGQLFILRRPGRDALLVRRIREGYVPSGIKDRRGQGVEVMYLLTSSVTLPARPYLRPSLWRNIPMIAGMMAGGTAAKTDVVFAKT